MRFDFARIPDIQIELWKAKCSLSPRKQKYECGISFFYVKRTLQATIQLSFRFLTKNKFKFLLKANTYTLYIYFFWLWPSFLAHHSCYLFWNISDRLKWKKKRCKIRFELPPVSFSFGAFVCRLFFCFQLQVKLKECSCLARNKSISINEPYNTFWCFFCFSISAESIYVSSWHFQPSTLKSTKISFVTQHTDTNTCKEA